MVFEGLKKLVCLLCFILRYYTLELFYLIFRCRPKKDIKGEHVLITGSAQGMGAIFAHKFAELGNTVHCVDVMEEMNDKMVDNLKRNGFSAFSYTCDIKNWESLTNLKQCITENGHSITYIVNNAGIFVGRNFVDLNHNQIECTIKVNLLGQFLVTKQFLPAMIENNYGHIINMASLGGYFPMRIATDYCASKAGSILFTDTLREELEHTKIKLTAVCPFFVNTKMITGIRDYLAAVLQPEEVVDIAIKGARENKHTIMIPRMIFSVFLVLHHMLPTPILRRIASMSGDIAKHDNMDLSKKFIGQGMAEKIK